MTFLRDEMVPSQMQDWRYGMLYEPPYEDWYFNLGYTADEISTLLFGA